MTIDPKYMAKIATLAESSGRTVEDVLNEVVAKGLDRVSTSQQTGNSSPESIERAKRIVERIRSLPETDADDGFSGSDHDQVLYPSDP